MNVSRVAPLTLREEIAKETGLGTIFYRLFADSVGVNLSGCERNVILFTYAMQRESHVETFYIRRHMQIHLGRLQRDFPLDLTV